MKQVLLLGDSIRMQYQPVVGQKLADIAEVSGPEENGRWSGYTLNSLRFWLPQLPSPDLYEETCRRICRILRKVTGKPDLLLVIATTTPTLHGDHEDIRLYNDILRKVAKEENAGINDLYAIVSPAKPELIGEDHIHLNPEGVEKVAEQTAKVLRAALTENGKREC